MNAGILEGMNEASEETIVRYARLLNTLARRNGLSNLRRAGDGHIVADIDKGRTYFDIAGFELEVESLIGASVDVIPSGAPSAAQKAQGPLRTDTAA